jgi:hypothetical protein
MKVQLLKKREKRLEDIEKFLQLKDMWVKEVETLFRIYKIIGWCFRMISCVEKKFTKK